MYLPHPTAPLATADIVAELLQIALTAFDITPGPGGSRMADYAEAMAAYRQHPWLQQALPSLWWLVTVIVLEPSAQIVAHTDPPIRGVRYHLPLEQNDGCWSFHAGRWQQLQTGRLYRMDPTQSHGAVNWGATVRRHLIIDCEET